MGGACCAEHREKQDKTYETIETSKLHKVKITFTLPPPPPPPPVKKREPTPVRIPTPEPEPVVKLEIESEEEDTTPILDTPSTFDQTEHFEQSPQEEVKVFKRIYRAVKGDIVDEIVQKIIFDMKCELPIIRVLPGRYLIGTDLKMLMIKGNICMVRVGGGWERLDEYIIRNQDQEIDKIKRLMVETNRSYEYVMVGLLGDVKADDKIIANYRKYSKYNIPQKCLPAEYQNQHY
eukprot:403335328